MIDLTATLAKALEEVVQRVQRSLVVLHNGHQGVGAGIIWRSDGVIVINQHVVAHGGARTALLDRHEYPARLVAEDPEVDLAILKIDANRLPPSLVADAHSLRVGQLVLAVGHPWGQRNVVTAGLISGFGTAQTRGPRHSVEVIRSDVSLAPGNSGGPLVNAAGAVVGINTMIVGGDQGIAIPSHVVSAFVEEALRRNGLARPALEAYA